MNTQLFARSGLAVLFLAAAGGAAFAQPDQAVGAQAVPDAREARINQLEAQVRQLSGMVSELSAEITDLKRGQVAQTENIQTIQDRKPAFLASLAAGKPSIASSDGKFSVNFHGIMQLDTAAYFQRGPGPVGTDWRRDGPALGASASNVDAVHARNLKDGDVFRRARIGIDGTAFGDWDYRFIFDFGGAGVENAGQVYETWVQYSGLKPLHFRVGAFSPSIGMEDQASTNSMPFIERSASSDIARGLAAGDTRTAAEIFAGGDHWLISGAVTGKTIGVVSTGVIPSTLGATAGIGTAQTFGDQLGFVGRFAGTPFHGRDWLVHVGVHGSYVIHPAAVVGPPNNAPLPTALNNQVIAFNSTPEIRVDATRFINTGSINARHASTLGAEFAVQKGPLIAQAEYEDFHVTRSDGTPAAPLADPSFHGFYVEGLWMLTGEQRKYNPTTAAFDAPPVAHPFSLTGGGLGAWELGFRYSDMNLNYRPGLAGSFQTGSGIRGGDEQNFNVSLSWYPVPIVRFLLDYQHVIVDRLSPAANAAGNATWLLPAPGLQIGQHFDVLAVRSQVAF
ncbi:MAG: porin [Caulobacteraceae bacterium]|nr:porin [Caulobacteraceae bacterium]